VFPRLRRWLRGALAVTVQLLTAADVLFSAITGWPRLSYLARRISAPLRDAWREGSRRPLPPLSVVNVTTVEDTTTDDS
jgi:hypothetical protein